jgi:putative PEP-CTERM system histidine kinase
MLGGRVHGVENIAVIGYLAAAAAYFGFAAYLWYSRRRLAGAGSRAPTLFLAAVLASALWAGFEAASSSLRMLLWPVGASVADLLRYSLWLPFLVGLVRANRSVQPRTGGASLRTAVAMALFAAALMTAWRILADQIDEPPSKFVLIGQLVLALLGLVLVEQLFRNVEVDLRWHAKPVCIGLAIVFAYDVFWVSEALMFGRLDADAYIARGPVHLLAVPLLFVAARRRYDWIAKLQVSRSAAFHSATLVLAGIYLLFISSVGYYVRYFGGSWGRAMQLSLLFAAAALLVVLMVSSSLRARLRVFVGKHFFSYRFDYREQWLQFTTLLSAGGSPQAVGQQVIQGLANMVECAAGSLWARPDATGSFVQIASWKMPQVDEPEPTDSVLSQFLRSTAWVIDLAQYRATPARYKDLSLPGWLLNSTEAWLVVPLLVGEDLLGFAVLARPRARIELNWELLDLLKTASRQAAGYMAQMQATEALLEARKFDAFNRMSAFVVHDLKNIVTQLSLMLKNAERLRDNREFQQDMLITVESSLEKMRRLMLQLREGAAPAGSAAGVDLTPIVTRLQALARHQGRTLDTRAQPKLATRGHDERLERVLGHLVQNALDATPLEGRVWLHAERYSGQVKIEVGDSGAGMSEEFIRTRLFKPFSSTKDSGMGVGSYESAQYVRELGGSISVTSQVGSGTCVTVLLPLFDTQGGSDLLRTGGA